MQDERATKKTVAGGGRRSGWRRDYFGSDWIRIHSALHFLILLTGVELAEQHGRVRGSEARDPPPAGGGGPPQLPGGGAHQPQEDRREAARGGARISTGVCV